ncbi:MAG: histidine phosphatase family protein [Candidatus Binataceae bacterium]
MDDRLIVMLVRHAESVPPGTPGYGEDDRPLTPAGRAAAGRLAGTRPRDAPIAIYSSPYPRARQTVEPLARSRGLAIEEIADLRERLLSAVTLINWREELAHSWRDFDYAPPGGETGRIAQARAIGVLNRVRKRHHTGTVVFASHGNLIALTLHAFAPSVGFRFWAAIPMPAVYRLEFADDRVTISGPGLPIV